MVGDICRNFFFSCFGQRLWWGDSCVCAHACSVKKKNGGIEKSMNSIAFNRLFHDVCVCLSVGEYSVKAIKLQIYTSLTKQTAFSGGGQGNAEGRIAPQWKLAPRPNAVRSFSSLEIYWPPQTFLWPPFQRNKKWSFSFFFSFLASTLSKENRFFLEAKLSAFLTSQLFFYLSHRDIYIYISLNHN